MTLMKNALENTMGKENVGNQHCFPFPSVFSAQSTTDIVILAMCNLSSANAFNLVTPNILSGNQHFLLFPWVFSALSKTDIVILAKFNLSANAFNLVTLKILSFSKRLTLYYTRIMLIFLIENIC